MLIGLAIVLAGLFELVFEYLVFAGSQSYIDTGSIKVVSRTDRFFPISTLVGVFAVVSGAAMMYFAHAQRRTERAD
jgi:hypothetical protein